jgi:hypothetical protein
MSLFCFVAACEQVPSDFAPGDEGLSVVEGRVTTPLADAYLYVYQEGMDLYGPAFAVSAASDSDGRFSLSLPEGDYIGVVRKRANGESSGPVVAGDHRSEFLTLKVRGGTTRIEVEAPLKVGDDKQLAAEQELTQTILSGRILDSEGRPVGGARVHVYDHVQMSERPKFVSEKTGPDGRYLIHLPEGGTYYLAARDKFGGPPKIGDLYGRYDQGTIEPSAVVLREGEQRKNVDIHVTRVW